MSTELSIIIPTYKRTGSLQRLLVALEKQTISDKCEIIVVDQNPLFFLQDKIKIQFLTFAKRIHLKSPNASQARNIGAYYAKSKILLFLDDDLIPTETFCEEGLHFLKEHPTVDALTPWVKNDFQNSVDSNVIRKIIEKESEDLWRITDTMSAALFFQREAFFSSGGFDPILFDYAKTGEDQEFFLRLPYKKIKLHYTNKLSIFHDELQEGGCELRTVSYWVTREKCIKSWVFRHRIHAGGKMHLSLVSLFQLYRSAAFNTHALFSGFIPFLKQIRLLHKQINATKFFLKSYKNQYTDATKIDHLSPLKRPSTLHEYEMRD